MHLNGYCHCGFNNSTYHGQSFFRVPQVVSDASGRQQVGKLRNLVENLTLRQHNEHDGNQGEASEGADDVEGVLGRGVVGPPGNGAGQSVGLGDVGAPSKQGKAGPQDGQQPDGATRYENVEPVQPHCCAKEQKILVYWHVCRPLEVIKKKKLILNRKKFAM